MRFSSCMRESVLSLLPFYEMLDNSSKFTMILHGLRATILSLTILLSCGSRRVKYCTRGQLSLSQRSIMPIGTRDINVQGVRSFTLEFSQSLNNPPAADIFNDLYGGEPSSETTFIALWKRQILHYFLVFIIVAAICCVPHSL